MKNLDFNVVQPVRASGRVATTALGNGFRNSFLPNLVKEDLGFFFKILSGFWVQV